MPETLFNLLNILPMPIWVGMLLFPRTRFTQRLVMAYWPYMVLGCIYALFLVVSLFDVAGSVSLSFDALRLGLTSDWAFLAVWAHVICLDLFAGVWIFRDAKYWGMNPGLFIILTLFFGPLGLAAYLFYRQRKSKTDPVKTLN